MKTCLALCRCFWIGSGFYWICYNALKVLVLYKQLHDLIQFNHVKRIFLMLRSKTTSLKQLHHFDWMQKFNNPWVQRKEFPRLPFSLLPSWNYPINFVSATSHPRNNCLYFSLYLVLWFYPFTMKNEMIKIRFHSAILFRSYDSGSSESISIFSYLKQNIGISKFTSFQ